MDFAEKQLMLAEFSEFWEATIGHLFGVPETGQLIRWASCAHWDLVLMKHSVQSLRARSKYPFDDYEHAMRFFSADLKRRSLGKLGCGQRAA